MTEDDIDYDHGSCHILAIALHQVTGKPIKACIVFNEEMNCTVLVHAWVEAADGLSFCSDGTVDTEEMLEFYPESTDPGAEIVNLTVLELLEICGISMDSEDVQQQLSAAADIACTFIEKTTRERG